MGKEPLFAGPAPDMQAGFSRLSRLVAGPAFRERELPSPQPKSSAGCGGKRCCPFEVWSGPRANNGVCLVNAHAIVGGSIVLVSAMSQFRARARQLSRPSVGSSRLRALDPDSVGWLACQHGAAEHAEACRRLHRIILLSFQRIIARNTNSWPQRVVRERKALLANGTLSSATPQLAALFLAAHTCYTRCNTGEATALIKQPAELVNALAQDNQHCYARTQPEGRSHNRLVSLVACCLVSSSPPVHRSRGRGRVTLRHQGVEIVTP